MNISRRCILVYLCLWVRAYLYLFVDIGGAYIYIYIYIYLYIYIYIYTRMCAELYQKNT